jgi:hypothetical protein
VCVGAQEYFRDVFDHLAHQRRVTVNAMLQTGISVTLTLVSIADSQVAKRRSLRLSSVPTLWPAYGMNRPHARARGSAAIRSPC